ncbi:hypothetical protein Bca101_089252 [Brassica carinata]
MAILRSIFPPSPVCSHRLSNPYLQLLGTQGRLPTLLVPPLLTPFRILDFHPLASWPKIANALGKKLLIDVKKARIQVSIEADKPLQFERRIGFPNGDIGKVTLTYEGLHRYCFTCKLISHDENSCPQLTPEEREAKRKQRAENHALNDQSRRFLQDSQGYDPRNSLKRPRSPTYGRQFSPTTSSKNSALAHEEKRRKHSPPLYSSREARVSGRQTRDLNSSSRQDKRQSHHGKEVWSRLEIPSRRDESKSLARTSDRRPPRVSPRYAAPRLRNVSSIDWRPRRSFDAAKNRETPAGVSRHAPNEHTERSRVTLDSQKTISDISAPLEPGEIIPTHRSKAIQSLASDGICEEERTRRLKGKAIATDSPTSKAKTPCSNPPAPRNTTLTITEKPLDPPQSMRNEQRYDPIPLEQGDEFMEFDGGLEQELDVPLAELELAEVDNLVLETECLEMDENMLDIDNDDLLGDSPGIDAEKIEAISQLSPTNVVTSAKMAHKDRHLTFDKTTPARQELGSTTLPDQANQPGPYIPKGLLKKKAPRSPDIKGAIASKKLQTLGTRTSPNKKTMKKLGKMTEEEDSYGRERMKQCL